MDDTTRLCRLLGSCCWTCGEPSSFVASINPETVNLHTQTSLNSPQNKIPSGSNLRKTVLENANQVQLMPGNSQTKHLGVKGVVFSKSHFKKHCSVIEVLQVPPKTVTASRLARGQSEFTWITNTLQLQKTWGQFPKGMNSRQKECHPTKPTSLPPSNWRNSQKTKYIQRQKMGSWIFSQFLLWFELGSPKGP